MSSLKELTQDATTEPLESRPKTKRAYSFFLFYQPNPNPSLRPVLQKLYFKIYSDKPDPRVVQLQLYNLEEEGECTQGLFDLRMATPQTKPKIVAYCEQERLLWLLELAGGLGIDLANTPLILAYPHPHSDFAAFTGWNSARFADLGTASAPDLQRAAEQWIQAAQERVDVWTLSIAMHQGGRLQKQTNDGWEPVEGKGALERRFLSHVSLGYHVKLSKNYRERCKQTQKEGVNRLIYGWESFKNFCCLRPPSLRAATGVLSINYRDQKGDSLEILKKLRDYDGSEEQERQASRVVRNDHGILSLVVSNIDRYHGRKLDTHLHSKPGDGHLEILLFEGPSTCRRIASVGDEITLRVDSETAIDIQVGEAVYRCWGCKQLKIRQSGRIRAAFNREVLEC